VTFRANLFRAADPYGFNYRLNVRKGSGSSAIFAAILLRFCCGVPPQSAAIQIP
jgi:hypothetical protein